MREGPELFGENVELTKKITGLKFCKIDKANICFGFFFKGFQLCILPLNTEYVQSQD